MNITEERVDQTTIDKLTALTESVMIQIRPSGVEDLIGFVDKTVHEWQVSGTPPKASNLDQDDLIYAFGTAWGDAVIAQHGWHWADLTFHDHGDWTGRAVVSADGSLFILPYAHIHECLSQEDEVKIGMSLNVIGSDLIPALEPGTYTNLTHNIQRIIPRQ